MPDESRTTEKPAPERDREFARAFLALHFEIESNVFRGGVEVLCRALEQAREDGRREQLKVHGDKSGKQSTG